VDLKAGPDGALYIADLYENRISHVDPARQLGPQDRPHLPRQGQGRKAARAVRPVKKTGPELVEMLASKNEWMRRTALRLIGDRKDKSLIPLLEKNIAKEKGQLALQSLWALNLCGRAD